MILVVLLWLWSNEDLLNLGFHELLVIDLLIQPIPLELEASIPSCVVDTSRSISFPTTHAILPMYTFESLCLDTEMHTPSTTGTSTTQSRTALVEHLHCPLNSLDCWNLASYRRHSDLRTNYKQFGRISALCPAQLSFTLEPDNSG